MTAKAVFGDLVFVDLCQYLRPSDLASLGGVSLIQPEGFDACAYVIERADGTVVEVRARDIDSTDGVHPRATDLGGGIRSDVLVRVDGTCVRDLVFPDDVALLVEIMGEGAAGDLCPIADKVVAAMVGRFDDGLVSKRVIPANSLARVDACDLLSESDVAAVPGIRARSKDGSLSKHQCVIGSDGRSEPRVSVRLAAGKPDIANPDDETQTVGGRTSGVSLKPSEPVHGMVDCWVLTYHQPIKLDGLAAVSEYAILWITVKQTDADSACRLAKDVASKVWPRLPAR